MWNTEMLLPRKNKNYITTWNESMPAKTQTILSILTCKMGQIEEGDIGQRLENFATGEKVFQKDNRT